MRDILIVVDVQNDFVTGSLGSEEAQKKIPNIVDKINNWNGLIYSTRDTHYHDYLDTLEGKNLPIKHCILGTEGHQIVPEVMNALLQSDVNTTIDKLTFGFIHWNNLLHDINSITLIGFCTDICVISNALILRALMPNKRIIVDSSCCAGVTPEKHNAALEVMKSCQIEVI